jgi:hypothetical protein
MSNTNLAYFRKFLGASVDPATPRRKASRADTNPERGDPPELDLVWCRR